MAKAVKHFFMYKYLLFILFFSPAFVFAQKSIPALERTADVNFNNTSCQSVLIEVGKKTNISFSYNSEIIETGCNLTLHKKNLTVREILNLLFQEKIIYSAKGDYIILKKAPIVSQQKYFYITGYISDAETGLKLSEVSVYDRVALSSCITNKYGYFSLKIPVEQTSANLVFAKYNYAPTTFSLERLYPVKNMLNMQLLPIAKIERTPNQLPDLNNGDLVLLKNMNSLDAIKYNKKSPISMDNIYSAFQSLIPKTERIHVLNLFSQRDTISRVWQVSFLPFMGTNGLLAGAITNDYSLNILAGYSNGVNKAELAGLFNIDRKDVKQFQAAGIANLVGGNVNGLQIGGVFNSNLGTTNGVQIGGTFNVCNGDVNGVQIGGTFNHNFNSLKGVQIAGTFNNNFGRMEGVQIGGVFNSNIGNSKGVQVAGTLNFNYGDTSATHQIAGVLNFSKKHQHGHQVAGILNVAMGEMKGYQVSGILNVANKKLQGHQIGFINYADSSSATPFGFLSFVRKNGYHPIELSANEIIGLNLSWKTGTKHFYNIFTAGMSTTKANTFAMGYGIGSMINISKRSAFNIDLVHRQLVTNGEFENWNAWERIELCYNIKLAKRFVLAFGPAYNFYFNDANNYSHLPERNLINTNYTTNIYNNSYVDVRSKSWLGINVSLKMF
jgi:hypothetical protein